MGPYTGLTEIKVHLKEKSLSLAPVERGKEVKEKYLWKVYKEWPLWKELVGGGGIDAMKTICASV